MVLVQFVVDANEQIDLMIVNIYRDMNALWHKF